LSWHRTVASWLLFQMGRTAACIFKMCDRWIVEPAYDAYQRLMALSCELDREGRVWKHVEQPSSIPGILAERVEQPPLIFEE
jgi:hypothetical protein